MKIFKIKNRLIGLLIAFLLMFTTSGCSMAERSPFKVVGAMSTPRSNHAATLLQDGRVLVTGGTYKWNEFKSAEIFDPKTNKFHRISDMNQPHSRHSATLLNDGRVLIVDTRDYMALKRRNEIFDPKSEQFSYTSDINYIHSSCKTILLDGREVLILDGDNIAKLNPENNTFKHAGKFEDYLGGFDAIKLPDGNIAIFGGNATSRTKFHGTSSVPVTNFNNKDVFVYNPTTEKITKAGEAAITRSDLKAILLNNGKILLVGGNNHSNQDKAEIYDIKTGKSVKINDTKFYYYNVEAVLLPNGKVLLVGGVKNKLADKAEIFNLNNNTFSIKKMHFNRGNCTTTLLKDGKVLITGGATFRSTPKRAEVYNYRFDK